MKNTLAQDATATFIETRLPDKFRGAAGQLLLEPRARPRLRSVSDFTLAALCITAIAALMITLNGGISVGTSNHAGLLPVVRRILDPGYLPSDFGITLRLYHHRIFALMVAAGSMLFGEDRALILVNIIGKMLLSYALYRLCRALQLSKLAFLFAGTMLAAGVLWTGRGLEINTLIGNAEIMPTTFAYACLLMSVASLLQQRYRHMAVWSGVAVLFHLQIGVIAGLAIFPLFLARIRSIGLRESLWVVMLGILVTLPQIVQLVAMLGRGVVGSVQIIDYIRFRQPYHFELLSLTAAVAVASHLAAQALAYRKLLNTGDSAASRNVRLLFFISLALAALALLHFTDYYLWKNGTLASVQFIRLSPLITLFGMLSIIVVGRRWIAEQRELRRGRCIFFAAGAGATVVTITWLLFSGISLSGLTRYLDQPLPWVDICRWIDAHGPKDTVYLAPPGQMGFTYLSNRSGVVEFKVNPDGGQLLTQWYERLSDLAGGVLPQARGFNNQALLDSAYAALNEQDLTALSAKYRAAYAVLPASSKVGFEEIYQNAQYRLVKIR